MPLLFFSINPLGKTMRTQKKSLSFIWKRKLKGNLPYLVRWDRQQAKLGESNWDCPSWNTLLHQQQCRTWSAPRQPVSVVSCCPGLSREAFAAQADLCRRPPVLWPFFRNKIWPEHYLKYFQPSLFTTSFLQFLYSLGYFSEICRDHWAAKRICFA